MCAPRHKLTRLASSPWTLSASNRVAEVSQAIDGVFRNSLAETLTETERAFQIGFVKQTEAILISIRIVSFVVIFIILAVMANTMAMTARERLREYATLKAIGFSPGYVARLILGGIRRDSIDRRCDRHRAHAPGRRAPCRALRDALPITDRERQHRHIAGTCGVGGRGPRRALADAPGSPCQHRQWSSGIGLTMPLLLAYSLRNLHVRKLTNFLTATGMALVVFVYAAVLMLDSGLKQTLVATGEDTNVIFVRRSAEVEIQSLIDRRQARIIESQPEIIIGAEGAPLVSKEAAVLISRPRRKTKQASNILIRGVGPAALAVRPQVRLAEGRMFRPGSNEIVIGGALAGRFEDVEIGSSLRFAHREWNDRRPVRRGRQRVRFRDLGR